MSALIMNKKKDMHFSKILFNFVKVFCFLWNSNKLDVLEVKMIFLQKLS